jgi:phage host-nuclease inhibitor protein Gam
MTTLKEFFWFCAGANQSLLKRCPTETSKFTGMGAAVFFTGLLAALSGGYAFYTVFDNIWWALGFGLLWGTVIFNLDRFIVSTMRKKKNDWLKEFVIASPRILLAVVLAIVISKPLELKIFSKEINRKLVTLEEEIYQREIADVESRYTAQLSTVQGQIDQLKQEIAVQSAKRDQLIKTAQEEADGTGGSMKRDLGPIYRIKKADADRAEQELTALRAINEPLIAQKQAEWDQLFQSQQTEVVDLKRNPWDGIAAQLQALKILGEENPAIYAANIFIIFLFMLLECTPIFAKLISPRGPYDELLEIREHFFKNLNLEKIAQMDHATYEKLKYYST